MRKKNFFDSATLTSLFLIEIVKFIFSLSIGVFFKKTYNSIVSWWNSNPSK